MSSIKLYSTFILLILMIGCSSKGDDPANDVNPQGNDDNNNDNTEEVAPPLAAELIFPEDNTECNEGEIESDFRSIVTFEWTAAQRADSYTVKIINLENQQVLTVNTTDTEAPVSISRGTPYEWYVLSQTNGTNANAKSETWQFFNAGPGIESHSPFPAELLSPLDDSVLDYGTDRLYLEWEGNDLDNDLLVYEVYFDTDNEFDEPVAITEEQSYFFWDPSISAGMTYYWQIKTIDQDANTSTSAVYSFTLN